MQCIRGLFVGNGLMSCKKTSLVMQGLPVVSEMGVNR